MRVDSPTMRISDVKGNVLVFHCAGSLSKFFWYVILNATINIPAVIAMATMITINPRSAATESRKTPTKKMTNGTASAIRRCFSVGVFAKMGLESVLDSWMGDVLSTDFLYCF